MRCLSRRITYCLGIFILLIFIELHLFHITTMGATAVLIDIPSGASIKKFSQTLALEGYIPRPEVLELLLRVDGRPIHAGEYRLTPGMSLFKLAYLVKTGKVHQYSLTIPEGIQTAQLLALLKKAPKLVDVDEAIAAYQLRYEQLEGVLLPETYFYAKGTATIDVLTRAEQMMVALLEAHWPLQQNPMLSSPREAVILASLIEKETAAQQEMPLIAGVLTRRLQERMRLQVDPTVIYALGADYTGRLQRSDMVVEHPYNTYRNIGLPPGPIAMPGKAAILAALYPKMTDALYYVSKGDGQHYFSATFEEHQQAIRHYLIQGMPNERSETLH